MIKHSKGPESTTLWADLAVLGVAVTWGASYPVAKSALAYAPALLLIFYRFTATAIIMLLFAKRDLASASPRDLGVGIVLGVILFSVFVAETWGISLTTATNAALIISLCMLITPFLDFGLKKRLPPYGVVTGALVGIMGVALLSGGITGFGPGEMLILLAAILRAIMVVSTKRLTTGRMISSGALTALQAVTVAVFSLTVLLLLGETDILLVDAGPRFWGAVGFLSLFCTIAAFYIQNAAIRRTTPTRVSLLMGTEPLFGFVMSWLLLSEPVTAMTLLGAALIVSGTFFALCS